MQRCGQSRGGGWPWGVGGQLHHPPALPGLRPDRTCRMRGCCQLGRPATPSPDLVGEMGPAWGKACGWDLVSAPGTCW